jgi:molecular chaperone DnaK
MYKAGAGGEPGPGAGAPGGGGQAGGGQAGAGGPGVVDADFEEVDDHKKKS